MRGCSAIHAQIKNIFSTFHVPCLFTYNSHLKSTSAPHNYSIKKTTSREISHLNIFTSLSKHTHSLCAYLFATYPLKMVKNIRQYWFLFFVQMCARNMSGGNPKSFCEKKPLRIFWDGCKLGVRVSSCWITKNVIQNHISCTCGVLSRIV